MPARTKVVALTCAVAMLVAPAAFARSVFLNGVDISGVKSQTFKNATVHIDHNGDVHVTAEGYKVQLVDQDPGADPASEADPAGGANPALSMRFFLATNPSSGGRAQYDLSISINGVTRKVIEAGSPAVIMEVSAWFKKGQNKVKITATKDLAGGRKSNASSDELQLLIGIGDDTGNKVQMKQGDIKVDFKVNASQTTTITQSYTVNAI